MNTPTRQEAEGFELLDFNAARPFSGFLPGIAGAHGKPLWVFYCNRGQGIASFGTGDRNGAMLEFHPADQAYALTPLHGFRSFFKLGPTLYEPFHTCPEAGVAQRLTVRPEEIEIEESHAALGLRIRVAYFTLPNEPLPVLIRRVTVSNVGASRLCGEVLDGLPRVVPFGLDELLLKQMSHTMQAFAEIRHVDTALPFYKLKVAPSDKPEVTWIDGGFFAFTLQQGHPVAQIADPDLVFGSDTSLRTPLAFLHDERIDPLQGRHDTLTGCAFAQLKLDLEAGSETGWDSYFGQAASWESVRALRQRIIDETGYSERKRRENHALIANLSGHFDLLAGPEQLGPYTRQAFLDNSLRGGQPVTIAGPRGPRVFHAYTRKHGDLERDYNFFQVAPTYWSQGSGNFRDVNQNRRSENFFFPGIDSANIATFFNLIQLDGNNPLVVMPEKFCIPPAQEDTLQQMWPEADATAWQSPFSPGRLLQTLIESGINADAADALFDRILGLAELVQDASHGEGYWVDHWIYNLDLLDSYAALYPDRLQTLLIERRDYTYFDNDHVVQPRSSKYVLRGDGTIRQLNAVLKDVEKTRRIARRREAPHTMRCGHGSGPIYRTTLLAKLINLLAIKASLLDPFGIGLEMEADKPGWCDALNGLPGLFGSATHEAYALRRGIAFVKRNLAASPLALPVEVGQLVSAVSEILANADTGDFFPAWQQLAAKREAFRSQTRLGVDGAETHLERGELLAFLDATDAVLVRGLTLAITGDGLPISYYIHEAVEFEILPQLPRPEPEDGEAAVHVQVTRFAQKPVAPFLEGAVHALRDSDDPDRAAAIYRAVRQSSLYDAKLGMYRVNSPLDQESFEIGRSRIFAPGWLENESIFLHMHYKFLLETLRHGLAAAFFEDLRRGLVAFQNPEIYGRSPLENSSFIASSRFPDAKVHGAGFVARLSGATAEWISMALHMGLGATPFRLVDGELRFEPCPILADWLFTTAPSSGFNANSFGLKLFGQTWIVYENPARRATFGPGAVAPAAFELRYPDGRRVSHAGRWLPQGLALDLREGRLASLLIVLN